MIEITEVERVGEDELALGPCHRRARRARGFAGQVLLLPARKIRPRRSLPRRFGHGGGRDHLPGRLPPRRNDRHLRPARGEPERVDHIRVREQLGEQYVPDEFIDGGETVVALGKYGGTYKATGKSFQANFAHIWKVQEGKAIRFIQYADTLIIHRALQP